MFQLAPQKQRRIDAHVRAPAVQHDLHTAGKQALTDSLYPRSLGEPDFYGNAVNNALRELDAIRATALPNYVAIRRKHDLAPLTKQIELAKAAMQVRHMILTANAHVYRLEHSQTYKNPMVAFLRARIERVVARATKLGVYDGALDMRPRAYVEPKGLSAASKQSMTLTAKPTNHAPHAPADKPFAGAITAKVTKPSPKAGNTASPRVRLPRARPLAAPPWQPRHV